MADGRRGARFLPVWKVVVVVPTTVRRRRGNRSVND